MAKDKIETVKDLVVIGGSAGSLQVVFYLLEQIPAHFGVPILLVLHRDPAGISKLAELLSTKTSLTVREIEDKDPIENGNVYVCPADYHVLIESDLSFSLDYSEKINFSRPSIDVCFQSAADVMGPKLTCILLSGANADGASGLRYAREKNGTTIVQDPEEAAVSYMPEQALLQGKADFVLGKTEISNYLQKLSPPINPAPSGKP